MTFEEALETTKIHSVAGTLAPDSAIVAVRPFRSPHHTISDSALVGGGMVPRPGEISMAHHGVLFLDELPEFARNVLEVLLQPLEDGHVTISRSKLSVTYPANFMLVCAMNPCPCGNYGNPHRECTCQASDVQRYLARLSGPLMDRIDLHIDVPAVKYRDLNGERWFQAGSGTGCEGEEMQPVVRNRRGLFAIQTCNPRDPTQVRHGKDSPDACKLGLSTRQTDIGVGRTIADCWVR
jgi:predicted ATPase with chaperone activity